MGRLIENPNAAQVPLWQNEAIRFLACPWWMRARWASFCLCVWAFVAMTHLGYGPTGDIGVATAKGVYYSVSERVYWLVVSAHSAFAAGVLLSVITLLGSMIATDKKLPWNYRSQTHTKVHSKELYTWQVLVMMLPIVVLFARVLFAGQPIGQRAHEPEILDYEPRSSLGVDAEQPPDGGQP